MKIRFWKPKPKPEWVVQLHRATYSNDRKIKILSSWSPTICRSYDEAVQVARRLRMDNRWGRVACFPCVTITDPNGVRKVA